MRPDPSPSLPHRRESKITFLSGSVPAMDVDSRLRGNDGVAGVWRVVG